jgi:hypothetical protein
MMTGVLMEWPLTRLKAIWNHQRAEGHIDVLIYQSDRR